ncbi:MAG: phage antirepressor KilAC domain-containing protein, partial [Lachnospiraceae bacterium]|nr:phage antirepressor KilAC domain-containing protein [Lachnospiraceae bacterium]
NGYLMKSGEAYNQPTQKSMDLGLMEIKKSTINNPDGSIRTTTTTKITGKGQVYFVNKFCGKKE